MKKVSTVAVKQSRKISQQKLTVGLDLGDRSSWYEKARAQSRVPVTALIAWPNCIFRDE
jgi:hypothetical protein